MSWYSISSLTADKWTFNCSLKLDVVMFKNTYKILKIPSYGLNFHWKNQNKFSSVLPNYMERILLSFLISDSISFVKALKISRRIFVVSASCLLSIAGDQIRKDSTLWDTLLGHFRHTFLDSVDRFGFLKF